MPAFLSLSTEVSDPFVIENVSPVSSPVLLAAVAAADEHFLSNHVIPIPETLCTDELASTKHLVPLELS